MDLQRDFAKHSQVFDARGADGLPGYLVNEALKDAPSSAGRAPSAGVRSPRHPADGMLKSRTDRRPAGIPLTRAHLGAEDSMSNIQLDIEWTEAASRKIEKLMPRGGQEAFLALPPVECLPMEGDVLFLGPDGKQQPFIVAERQYHHDGDADWTIILILDVPQATH